MGAESIGPGVHTAIPARHCSERSTRVNATQERDWMQEQRSTTGVTRRQAIRWGVAAGAVASFGGLLEPALSGARGRPRRRLSAGHALQVDPREFMPLGELRGMQERLDEIGLRATGSRVHARYADDLAARLERAGVSDVRTEPVPLRRWQPGEPALDVLEGAEAGAVTVANYIPYSGSTAAGGTTAPLAADPGGALAPGSLAGRIVLFDVADAPLTNGFFDAIDYGQPHHSPGYDPSAPYLRPWAGQGGVGRRLEALRAAGAVGAIGVLSAPLEAARGTYMPYDGKLRDIPALFLDSAAGARLRGVARAGGNVRLTLAAEVDSITTPNLVGVIPGASDELVILQSHHDGTNGVEDNGQEAIVAMSQYLARLPKGALPRTVLVLLSTGHFAGDALGTESFIARHRDDVIAQTKATVTIEHLGAGEWLPNSAGVYEATGRYELGGFFSSPYSTIVDLGRAALQDAKVTDDRLLKPFSPDPRAPNGKRWPGDGEGFWAMAGLASLNFITGPTYLLGAGFDTSKLVDVAALRRQAIAFTDLVLQLTRAPAAGLGAPDLS
jgi:hypothetical protein